MADEKQPGQQNPPQSDAQRERDNQQRQGGTQQDPQRQKPGQNEGDRDQQKEKKKTA
jgi:hypothetical protein